MPLPPMQELMIFIPPEITCKVMSLQSLLYLIHVVFSKQVSDPFHVHMDIWVHQQF